MDKSKYEAFKAQLKGGGVQVAAVPQLFETPDALAARMVELADIQPGNHILEPSAGRGAILRAVEDAMRVEHYPIFMSAIEINEHLSGYLKGKFPAVQVVQGDFLQTCASHAFDRIVMNPPFVNAQDIAHIKHAAKLLKPGGRLVAICADGPRQRESLQRWATTYEALPAGTFKDSGTMVNAAILTFEV